jgi:hypothetical protein
MAMLTKETALEVAYIGAGAVAGKIAGNKIYSALPSTLTSKLGSSAPYVEGAIPVLIGLFLPSVAGRSTIVRGLANGMIASGASTIVGTAFDQVKGATAGVGNVMMGNVMMGNVIETPLMGSTAEGYNTYSDTSYDFTNADAGEMDF